MGKRKQSRQSPAAVPVSPPHQPDARRWLAAIVAAYLVIATGAACVAPPGGIARAKLIPPDEPAHWAFVTQVASGGGLPLFTSGSGNFEAHQPPLYYLSALWTYWLAGERGLMLARLWSVVLGGLTLIVAWRATRWLLGEAVWPRLGAVGALAFIPGRVFICAAVNNDPLAELLMAAVLGLCLEGIHQGVSRKAAGWIGLGLGLALLTKTSALVLIPLVAIVFALEPAWRQLGWRHLLTNALLVAGIVGLVWGWWVARNMVLYGEPLAIRVFQTIFLKDRATPEFFLSRGISWGGYWTLVGFQTWLSLWGVFGQATVYMPVAFYGIGSGLAVVAGLGLVRGRLQRDPATAPEQPARHLCWELAAVLLLLVVATFLRFNTVFYQAQARYLLGASVVLACLLAAGVYGLVGGRPRAWPALAVTGLLGAMAVWAVVAHITGGYSFLPPTIG